LKGGKKGARRIDEGGMTKKPISREKKNNRARKRNGGKCKSSPKRQHGKTQLLCRNGKKGGGV